MSRPKKAAGANPAKNYRHPDAESLLRPDVGTQAHFKKKKPPKTYRYDSSLSPALDWDGQNPAREQGEELIQKVLEAQTLEEAKQAAAKLKALGRPFLNWAGKAERLSFDVPTLPLFVHERLSTKAILETLRSHKRERGKQLSFFDLFGNPGHSIADQVLRAYEHKDEWVNRMILGDSLVVMNSLLSYESLGGQVQMIYMDPPYGVKFGSNFQPFVRKRDVAHNDDEDMTREPEMVQAYRDTWELGLHSYLTYLRDRLLLCRELLAPSGSIFVQISDENLHHVREVMDEVFGGENFLSLIVFQKKTMPLGSEYFEQVSDYILWYGRDKQKTRTRTLFRSMETEGDQVWSWVELADGCRRKITREEIDNHRLLPDSSRVYRLVSMLPAQFRPNQAFDFEFEGMTYKPPSRSCWKTDRDGMSALAKARRLQPAGQSLQYVLFQDDYPASRLTAVWHDTGGASDKVYAVQTSATVVQRCILSSTDPGDLVLDPTCGSGTTAYVAEQWGRRWITIDTSRVPLALARQRLLTATFPWYELKDEGRGPAGGFVYKRKQNKKGEEVGGIVPHVTLKSIANNEPPKEEVLVDRPEVQSGITRVSGPFCVEATIPTPVDWEGDGVEDSGAESAQAHASFIDRMLEVLRKSPVLRLEGNRTVTLKNVRPPAKTLTLSAEAVVADAKEEMPVAFVFGPENGAVSEKLVWEAIREAQAKRYTHLYVIGFAIQPNARTLVDESDRIVSIPATYVQATPDLLMGDLLKNLRSSQIFSVCGLPEVQVHRSGPKGEPQYQVELLGLDLFDPVETKVEHRQGSDVPAWFLDTDYNGLCFHVSQAFFPRTEAWDNLKRALKGEYDDQVWEHLAGTKSAPFEAGEHRQVAVKVIDDRGNELLVIRRLTGSEG
jgi:adenine-specific DNA-methyltransferase